MKSRCYISCQHCDKMCDGVNLSSKHIFLFAGLIWRTAKVPRTEKCPSSPWYFIPRRVKCRDTTFASSESCLITWFAPDASKTSLKTFCSTTNGCMPSYRPVLCKECLVILKTLVLILTTGRLSGKPFREYKMLPREKDSSQWNMHSSIVLQKKNDERCIEQLCSTCY
jgi:hypothetical protein